MAGVEYVDLRVIRDPTAIVLMRNVVSLSGVKMILQYKKSLQQRDIFTG